jgi:transcriptional antiterminator RfaH
LFFNAARGFRNFLLMVRSNETSNPQSPHAEVAFAWFCLRSQPKHEHIAAGHLRRMGEVEVFNPRIRFTRSTRQGAVVVTESLFPNYLFARFDFRTALPRVHYAPGVAGVVHFGERWPTVPDRVIEEIRTTLGQDEVHVVPPTLAPGDEVQVAGGIMHGLHAVITQVMPGRQRVMVLMDFLGRQTTVQLAVKSVVKPSARR